MHGQTRRILALVVALFVPLFALAPPAFAYHRAGVVRTVVSGCQDGECPLAATGEVVDQAAYQAGVAGFEQRLAGYIHGNSADPDLSGGEQTAGPVAIEAVSLPEGLAFSMQGEEVHIDATQENGGVHGGELILRVDGHELPVKVDGNMFQVSGAFGQTNWAIGSGDAVGGARFAVAKALYEAGYHIEWVTEQEVWRSRSGRHTRYGDPVGVAFSVKPFTPLELAVKDRDWIPYRPEFALYELTTGENPDRPVGYAGFQFEFPKPPGYDAWKTWFELRKEGRSGWLPQNTWAAASTSFYNRYAERNVTREMQDVRLQVRDGLEARIGKVK